MAVRCSGRNVTSQAVSATVEIEAGPVLQVLITLASATTASGLDSIAQAVARALNIDVRRIEATFGGTRRQAARNELRLDVVAMSDDDAKSLKRLADEFVASALRGIGFYVSRLQTHVASVEGGSKSSGLSTGDVVGLAVGLGAGVPLLILMAALCVWWRRCAGQVPAGAAQPPIGSREMLMGKIGYALPEASAPEHAGAGRHAAGSDKRTIQEHLASMPLPSVMHKVSPEPPGAAHEQRGTAYTEDTRQRLTVPMQGGSGFTAGGGAMQVGRTTIISSVEYPWLPPMQASSTHGMSNQAPAMPAINQGMQPGIWMSNSPMPASSDDLLGKMKRLRVD
jgi:hypothetical protein